LYFEPDFEYLEPVFPFDSFGTILRVFEYGDGETLTLSGEILVLSYFELDRVA